MLNTLSLIIGLCSVLIPGLLPMVDGICSSVDLSRVPG